MARSATHAQPPSLAFNLLTIALLAAVASLGAAYGLDALGRQPAPQARLSDAGQTLVRTMGGKDLTVPRAWFRYGEQQVEGFASEIALAIALPLGPDGAARTVDVTLVPKSRVRPSAALLDSVYVHAFEAEQVAGIDGLVGKPLTGHEGYADETVWYDPLSANPFVAKCLAPLDAKGPGRCLRTVVLAGSIAATYAFDADLLPHWRDFDAAAKPWFERIGIF